MIASLAGLPVALLVFLFLAALGAFGWLLWSQIKRRASESAPSEMEPQPGGEYPPDLAPASAPLETGALVAQIQGLFDAYRAAADEDLAVRLQDFGRSLPKAQAGGDAALTAAVGRLEKTMGELRGRLDELAAVVARQSEAAAVHAASAAPAGAGASSPGADPADIREALEYFYIRLADQLGTLRRAVEDVKGARPSGLAGHPPEGQA